MLACFSLRIDSLPLLVKCDAGISGTCLLFLDRSNVFAFFFFNFSIVLKSISIEVENDAVRSKRDNT